jgi:hypothetical protein
VSLQLIQELERIAAPAIELNGIVPGDGEGAVVGGEGVIRNWIVEKMMDLGLRHIGRFVVGNRSSSLLLRKRCLM